MHSIILGAEDRALFDFVNCTQMSAYMKEQERMNRKEGRKKEKKEKWKGKRNIVSLGNGIICLWREGWP